MFFIIFSFCVFIVFFFFFQAEDGIRDGRVTGVQTCALPIYRDAQKHHLCHAQSLAVMCDVYRNVQMQGHLWPLHSLTRLPWSDLRHSSVSESSANRDEMSERDDEFWHVAHRERFFEANVASLGYRVLFLHSPMDVCP